jgi:putative transcriptional regulator
MKTMGKRVSVDEIPELTERDFARAISSKQRERILRGRIEGGDDIVALRRFTGLTQEEFASALAISVYTLRNWEQGRRTPEGPALALLRVAARHPRVLRENQRMSYVASDVTARSGTRSPRRR